jgi:glycine/D-amino acid oxidase-like deaminating enzyme
MAIPPHVLVVGAGIVGASIAWHLARAGARVTVLDAGEPGGVATRISFAWINASWGNPEPYFRLRVRAMEEWHRLEREVPGIPVAWVGGLFWQLPPDQLAAFEAQHAAWGYGIRRIGRAEIARLEPHLAAPPEVAVHVPAEGVVEPLAAAEALLAAAQRLGATIVPRTSARALALRGDRVTGVEADGGRIDADEVVVAAGVGTTSLVATAGLALPMVHAPGLFVRSAPGTKRLNGLLISPSMELRQTPEGRCIAVGEFDDTAPHADAARAAAALLDGVTGMIMPRETIVPDFYAVARRPMLRDGFPAVGRADGLSALYVAVTHSGITLAPAIGRFVAEELLTGRRERLLEPYGLGRFL